MKKTVLFVIAIMVVLATACAQSQAIVQTAIAQTQSAWTATPTIAASTETPTVIRTPTIYLTHTPLGRVVPTVSNNVYAWNYLAEQASGGVNIQVARLLIGDRSAIADEIPAVPALKDCPVVAQIIFIITNDSKKAVNIYPGQGTVVAGSEQVSLPDFAIGGEFGDKIDGIIYPGVKATGGIWFCFKSTALGDIQKMTIAIGGPFDLSPNRLGPDYLMTIDLSQRKNEPVPGELK